MSDMPAAPRKHTSNLGAGEEFETIQYTVTREMVDFWLIGINDRHEWYVGESPFGGAVAPPVMCQMAPCACESVICGETLSAPFSPSPPMCITSTARSTSILYGSAKK